jgi:CheY-like chemotaxis protein
VNSRNLPIDFSPRALKDSRKGARLILSVDDEPALLVTRERLLQSQGYDVLSACDGGKALKIFTAYPINLVLLDYSMPGVDGRIVAQEMKRCKPLVPVILVSADDVPEEALTCVDGFVAKGQSPALLLGKIQQMFATM